MVFIGALIGIIIIILEIEKQIFNEIELAAPKNCLLASNTSVIQISKIMGDLKLKNRHPELFGIENENNGLSWEEKKQNEN